MITEGKAPNGRLLWLICLVATLTPGMLQAVELDSYPGAEVVESGDETEVITRRVILGSLEKVNNVLKPELVEFVSGTRQATTYFFPHERRVKKVVAFFRDQLSKSTNILFECKGRDCGSSNYWANTIYGKPILYGPEQYQHYLVGRSEEGDMYVAIYVGQRGTRKIYAHVETIRVPVELAKGTVEEISAALKLRGRYVFFLPESGKNFDTVVQSIAGSMDNNEDIRLTLVMHDHRRDRETIEQSLERTSSVSASIRASLISAGIAPGRLSAYGVGPLSPLENSGSPRLELLVIE